MFVGSVWTTASNSMRRFWKEESSTKGVLWDHSLKNPKFFLVPLPSITSNSQQTEKNIVCGIRAKIFWKSSLQMASYRSKFWKTGCSRELQKSCEAGDSHTNKKMDIESTVENRKTLVLKNSKFLDEICVSRKWILMTKNVNFPLQCCSDSSERMHTGHQDKFGIVKVEPKGVL